MQWWLWLRLNRTKYDKKRQIWRLLVSSMFKSNNLGNVNESKKVPLCENFSFN